MVPPFYADPAGKFEVGLAWHIRPLPSGQRQVWHNGGTGGYRSSVGFLPEHDAGVVILVNTANDVDGQGDLILDWVLAHQ